MPTNNSCNYVPIQYNVQTGGASGTLNNVAPSATSGVPVISQGASAQPVFGTAVVEGGGTGVTSFANTSALLASGTTTTGTFQNIASVATGQVLVSAGTSTIPAWSAAPTVTSITFGAGSALSSYVSSGTFTPVLSFGGGTTGITYSSQAGHYTRIGNIIAFDMTIVLTNKGSSTGTMAIAGLPFSAANATACAMSTSVMTFTGLLFARVTSSSIFVDAVASTGARALLDNTNFANTTLLQTSGIYLL